MDNKKPEGGIPFKTPTPFKINGDWNLQSARLKTKFPQLTDGDLKFEVGKENEMIRSVEARLHKNREEVISIIEKNESEKA
jgi:hypothetical protein